MARILERAHPLERDRAADVDVRRGDVDPELHPQRAAEPQLLREPVLGQQVHCVPCEGRDVGWALTGGRSYPPAGSERIGRQAPRSGGVPEPEREARGAEQGGQRSRAGDGAREQQPRRSPS